jgi:hypothetical protein
MTRLKYYQTGDLLYTDWFTLGPNLVVRGIINTSTFSYQVIEFNSEVVSEGTNFRDLRTVKSILKAQLLSAGVNFTDEIRKG